MDFWSLQAWHWARLAWTQGPIPLAQVSSPTLSWRLADLQPWVWSQWMLQRFSGRGPGHPLHRINRGFRALLTLQILVLSSPTSHLGQNLWERFYQLLPGILQKENDWSVGPCFAPEGRGLPIRFPSRLDVQGSSSSRCWLLAETGWGGLGPRDLGLNPDSIAYQLREL